jgi:hypothetical protein
MPEPPEVLSYGQAEPVVQWRWRLIGLLAGHPVIALALALGHYGASWIVLGEQPIPFHGNRPNPPAVAEVGLCLNIPSMLALLSPVWVLPWCYLLIPPGQRHWRQYLRVTLFAAAAWGLNAGGLWLVEEAGHDLSWWFD